MTKKVSASYHNYVKGTTEPIKQILSNYNIKVALKPHHTIGNLFPKPKDAVPKDQTHGAINFPPGSKNIKKAVLNKHPHKSVLAGTLFTFWPHHLLEIFKDLTYKHKLEKQTYFRSMGIC